MDVWTISIFWLLWIALLWTYVYVYFFGYHFHVLTVYLEAELQGYMVILC